jgi:glyoxylase-like metal-dependent hydrolase (beta-lactamase superfamily II)
MICGIHTYSGSPKNFFVNSFLIETDSAVIVIDTQFVVSEAQGLKRQLQALAKPLAAVVISHPHPDHFNGTATLLEGLGPVPVYATRATIETIDATRDAKRKAWTPVYGNDYPAADRLPDQEIGHEGLLKLAGIELRSLDLGGGESADNTVIHLPEANALIASDLIYNRCHPWLAEHRTTAWLQQLDRVEAAFGGIEHVYAGHGPAGSMRLFAEQRRYIAGFREVVASHSLQGSLSDGSVAAIVAATSEGRDNWPLQALSR